MNMKKFIFLALLALGTTVASEEISLRFFNKNIPLDVQVKKLEACGIFVNQEVRESDFYSFYSREEIEQSPYIKLVETLAIDVEREPYIPIANSLWMCDYERIDDHGSYIDIIKRLELMTNSALKLSEVNDFVDIEEDEAWVEFMYAGDKIRWDAKVDNDWMDPFIIVKYDQLLKNANTKVRIYSNHTDYGQSALFAAFTDEQFNCFKRLSKVKLALIESQT